MPTVNWGIIGQGKFVVSKTLEILFQCVQLQKHKKEHTRIEVLGVLGLHQDGLRYGDCHDKDKTVHVTSYFYNENASPIKHINACCNSPHYHSSFDWSYEIPPLPSWTKKTVTTTANENSKAISRYNSIQSTKIFHTWQLSWNCSYADR